MGRVTHHSATEGQLAKSRLVRLKNQRQKLATKLNKVDAEIGKLESKSSARDRLSPGQLDRLMDELSAGLQDVRSLPSDFSRADLYEDHD